MPRWRTHTCPAKLRDFIAPPTDPLSFFVEICSGNATYVDCNVIESGIDQSKKPLISVFFRV